ncbi:MAG: hypothetical protein ACR2M1_01360 [Gemmatimonadaceae bacterium]
MTRDPDRIHVLATDQCITRITLEDPMQPPRFLAAIPVLDRFTLPHYDADTLASLAASGTVSGERLAKRTEEIGPVGCVDVLHATIGAIQPRRASGYLSGDNEVRRERMQVKLSETILGSAFVSNAVELGRAEDALPFLRWGNGETAAAGVRALNEAESSHRDAPLDQTIFQMAADAVLDRGAEDPELGGPNTVELVDESHSCSLFHEIADSTARFYTSSHPEVRASASRGEVAMREMMAKPECKPKGLFGVDSGAMLKRRIHALEVTGDPTTVEVAWCESAHHPDEAGAVLVALARIASGANERVQASTVRCANDESCIQMTLGMASSVIHSVARGRGDSFFDTRAVQSLRKIARESRYHAYDVGGHEPPAVTFLVLMGEERKRARAGRPDDFNEIAPTTPVHSGVRVTDTVSDSAEASAEASIEVSTQGFDTQADVDEGADADEAIESDELMRATGAR